MTTCCGCKGGRLRDDLTDLKFRAKVLLTVRAMETEKTMMKTMAKDDDDVKTMAKDKVTLKMARMDDS